MDRAERLVAVQAISREEYDARTAGQAEGEAAVRAAEADVATARLNLEWTEVRSPISGRVSRAEVTEGNLVQAGPPTATLLTTVVSLDPIYVYFEGDEQTYLKYTMLARAGTRPSSRDKRNPVYIGLANEEGFPHEGYVDFVDNQLNPESGTIRARAVLSNKDRLFTPGLFARIKLVGSGRYRAGWSRTAPSAPTRTRNSCCCSSPTAPSSTGRCSSAAWWTACGSCRRVLPRATRSS